MLIKYTKTLVDFHRTIQKDESHINSGYITKIRFQTGIMETGAERMTTKKRTVFVVDDEEILRSLTCDLIAAEGYTVLSASNGREAVEVFKEKGGEIGLVVLDMSMPEMDGTQTFQALRELDPTLKVVMASGFTDDPHVKHLIEHGAHGQVPKPFKVDELLKIIRSAMGE